MEQTLIILSNKRKTKSRIKNDITADATTLKSVIMPKACVETATVKEAAKNWHFSALIPTGKTMLLGCVPHATIHSIIRSFVTSSQQMSKARRCIVLHKLFKLNTMKITDKIWSSPSPKTTTFP